MKKIVALIILINSFCCFSQEKEKTHLFFDENNKPVKLADYLKKCDSFLYVCNKQERDSIILNTTFERYKFGKLTKTETSQVQKLLAKNANTEDLKNKTIIITFIDSIAGFKDEKLRFRLSSSPDIQCLFRTEYEYNYTRKMYDSAQKRCSKRFRKYNIASIYLYKENENYTHTSKNLEWHKIHAIIDNLFFNSKNSMMLILKPDGNYFRYDYIPIPLVKNLLKKDWTPYVKEYQVAKENLLKKRNGFFKEFQMNIGIASETTLYKPKFPKEILIFKNKTHLKSYINSKSHSHCFAHPFY